MGASRKIYCFLRQGFPEWNTDVTKCLGTEKEMVVIQGYVISYPIHFTESG